MVITVMYNMMTGTEKYRETTGILQKGEKTCINPGHAGGLACLQKGQQISGVVTGVDKQVTLDFDGQEVSVSRESIKDASIGDVKTFEVVRATDQVLELKLLGNAAQSNGQTFVARVGYNKDKETFLSQKEQDSKQAERENQMETSRKQVEEILSGLTSRDYQLLEQEGFPIGSYTIEGLHAAIRRVKAYDRKKTEEVQKERKENTFTAEEIRARLASENLPATRESVQKVSMALELSEAVSKINDDVMKGLINQGSRPTIGNIYRACYSGNPAKKEQMQEFTSQTWGELESQAAEVIEASGYEVSKENLADARWLLENNLPLTRESFSYKKELETIKQDTTKEMVLDRIMEGMKNKTAPLEVSLHPVQELSYDKLMSDINSIGQEAVTIAVAGRQELTIRNLAAIQEKLGNGRDQSFDQGSGSETVVISKDTTIEAVKAQRQLEEIRLRMTAQAATRLEKQGFHIETQELEKVVDALKQIEESYYKGLLSEAGVDGSGQNIQILKETTQSLEQLKFAPEYVIGSTLAVREKQTIPDLLEEGNKLQSKLAKAGEAYEVLSTVPNREYGDSIQKAFHHIAAILEELGMEDTQSNQRAVRILGYNNMELTEENINRVKAYDLEVNTMIKNLHPAVTVRMIKEGSDPLQLPIHELNQKIQQIKEEQGITKDERFSTYLLNLEKEAEITADERKAYIGFYRLLHTIEQTDGAALGAVINADREVTLDHLLTAVRTYRKGRLDTRIDDSFGVLESLSSRGESITQQLEAVFMNRQESDLSGKESAAMEKEQKEYMLEMIRQMKEELTPQKLQSVTAALSSSPSEEGTAMDSRGISLGKEDNMWESIKDVSVEKLYEMLGQQRTGEDTVGEIYADKVQSLSETLKNSGQAVRFLKELGLPDNISNIMMADHLLRNEEIPDNKMLSKKQENDKKISKKGIKEFENLSDILNDKTSMNKVYETLEKEARAALDQAAEENVLDTQNLAQLKSIGMQMSFLKTLAGKEFYRVPMETENGITNINLTIIRGTGSSGKVNITVWSEQLGNLRAELSIRNQTLQGFVRGDNWNGLDKIKNNTKEIYQTAQEDGLEVRNFDYAIRTKEKEENLYQDLPNALNEASGEADMERKLYRLAKAFLCTVRETENVSRNENVVRQ